MYTSDKKDLLRGFGPRARGRETLNWLNYILDPAGGQNKLNQINYIHVEVNNSILESRQRI